MQSLFEYFLSLVFKLIILSYFHHFENLLKLDLRFGHLRRIILGIGMICKSGLFASVCPI